MQRKLIALSVMATLQTSVNAADFLQFTNAPVPTNDLDKRSILTSQFGVLNDSVKFSMKYNVILRSGDKPEGSAAPFGQIHDSNGNPIMEEDGSVFISNSNDFSSLLTGKDGGKYMVSHFESRPAAMYLTELNQDANGKLTAKRTRPLDFSAVKGGWVHCAGSVTPWGNHLGSEEYPPNSKQWLPEGEVDDYNAMMARYFGVTPSVTEEEIVTNQAAVKAAFNPYDYGFVTEVAVANYDSADVVKHYSMGRVAIELAYVMPNERTVYISDDGGKVGLFRYEADKAGDLSSGTLYAAKWTQTSKLYTGQADPLVPLAENNGGTADISWVELGTANDDEIKAIIDSGITVDKIFDFDGEGCTTVTTRDGTDCLSLKQGQEKAAAFLETSRYAALVGATLEFEKMEGITHNPETNTMYLAMSRVRKAMSDGEGDIQVPLNYCGTVYALDLDNNYVANNMYGVVSGIPRTQARGAEVDNPYPADGAYAKNDCDVNGIAEPDNVTYLTGMKTLVIGEDTGRHQNDMIWAYSLESGTLSRLQTTPYGSETTSPYFYPNYHGFPYLMSVIQHPFGESDEEAMNDVSESRGYTGYIGFTVE